MFCTKCGENNSDRAVYCQKCGEMLEAEEETRVAGRPSSPRTLVATASGSDQGGGVDAKIFSISPTLMFVKIGYVLAIAGAFLLVALVSVFLSSTISVGVGVLLGLLLLLIPAFFI